MLPLTLRLGLGDAARLEPDGHAVRRARTACCTGSTSPPAPARSPSAARGGSARGGTTTRATPGVATMPARPEDRWSVLGAGVTTVTRRDPVGWSAAASRSSDRWPGRRTPTWRRSAASTPTRGCSSTSRSREHGAYDVGRILHGLRTRRLVRARQRGPGRPHARRGHEGPDPARGGRRRARRPGHPGRRSTSTSATPSRSCRWSTAPRRGSWCATACARSGSGWGTSNSVSSPLPQGLQHRDSGSDTELLLLQRPSLSARAGASRPAPGRPARAPTGRRAVLVGGASSGPSRPSSAA